MKQNEEVLKQDKKEKITFYVIGDIATWTDREAIKSVWEHFQDCEKAMEQFRIYAYEQNDVADTRMRATLGIRMHGVDYDVVYRVNGKNILSLEFAYSERARKDSEFLATLQKICRELPVSHVRIHRNMTEEERKSWVKTRFQKWIEVHPELDGSISTEKFETYYKDGKLKRFLPSRLQQDIVEHVPIGEWKNPYFEMEAPEYLAFYFEKLPGYVCMQTSEIGFDYTVYDPKECLLDGGVINNEHWSIWEAMDDLMQELEVNWQDAVGLDYEKIEEKTGQYDEA